MFETTNQLKSLYTSVSPILMGKLMVAGKNLFRNSASSTMTLPWKVTTLFQNVKIGRAPKERARCVICIIVFIFQDTLLYTIIHYYTLLYTIIHYYTLLYTIIHYTIIHYYCDHYTLLFFSFSPSQIAMTCAFEVNQGSCVPPLTTVDSNQSAARGLWLPTAFSSAVRFKLKTYTHTLTHTKFSMEPEKWGFNDYSTAKCRPCWPQRLFTVGGTSSVS
jgi:hypothetical protein